VDGALSAVAEMSASGACEHCGLPSPRGARWCCYGCELCAQVAQQGREDHGRLYGVFAFSLVLSMIVMMLSLFLYAEDVFDAAADVEMAWLREAYRWAALLLATPVMGLCAVPLLRRAMTDLRARRLGMEGLITVGGFAAYGTSIWAVLAGRSGVYFDSATAAVVLATFGRYLEATARSRASASLGPLLEVSHSHARRLESDGTRVEIAPAEIEPGTTLEVDPGDVVPVDLRLQGGPMEVDLAVLTGESRPVVLAEGAVVPAGAVPISGSVRGVALRAARDSTLERLAELARGLRERPSRLLRWADRFATALLPGVAAIALGAFAVRAWSGSPAAGLIAALAVLLCACPCSYAIASPLVHWLMLRQALARGVLIRGADVLEALAGIRAVALDKTGTLTRPDLHVTGERIASHVARVEVLSLIRALEDGSPHPVGRALLRHAGTAMPAPLGERRILPARGVEALDEHGRRLFIGASQDGEFALRRDDALLATFQVDEEIRPEAAEAIAALRATGLRVMILSGDAPARAERIGQVLHIEARGGLGPVEKAAALDVLGLPAALVGDGVNDAPALASRITGFAVGDATGLARGVAQVTLLEPDLRLVPFTIALARRGMRLVRWLIGASTAYNLVFVALAASGALRPVWAGLSMLVSSLLTVAFAAGIGAGDEPAADRPGAPALAAQRSVPC